jgi:hypothetical protein
MKRLKGFLGVFFIFVFGVIVGGVLVGSGVNQKLRSLIEGGPDRVVDAVAKRLRSELKLDEQQQKMLEHIVMDTQIKLAAIRQKTQPEVASTLAEAEQRVRGILNPEQDRKFDNIVRKGHDRWRQQPPPPTPAPPPAPKDAPASS